jgi:DNA ligase-1
VRAVLPEVVLEVSFDSIQKSTRHKSGFALRFPRIVRLRSDKRPEEVDTLQTVAELYDKTVGR